jgi:hypothetical protein
LPDFGNLKVSKSATADFDARVSKDGRLRGRRLLPSFETAAQEGGLLRMRLMFVFATAT